MKKGTLNTQVDVVKFLGEADFRAAKYDRVVPGLQLERLSKDHAKWRLRAVDERGRRKCITLGDASQISLGQARMLAYSHRTKLAMGEDPTAEKVAKRSIPTFAQFIAERYMPYIRSYKKSANSDDGYLRIQILPVLGHKYLDEITKKDIIDLQHGLIHKGYKPGTINRALVLVRYAMNLALKWEIPGVKINPTKDVRLLNDEAGKRDRFLTPEETQRLFEAVRNSENPLLQYIVPFLLLTGARKREALDARWEDFDLERRQWCIPFTKAGRPRYVPLSNSALNLLAHVPRIDQNPWVFPNPKTGKPYQSIFGSWNTARKSVGLHDIKIHSLRHSFASFLVNSGRSLYEVQRILGHSQARTTMRYSHLAPSTLLAAADAASQSIGVLHFAPQIIKPAQLGYRNV